MPIQLRNSARVSRRLRLLRAHGLIQKVLQDPHLPHPPRRAPAPLTALDTGVGWGKTSYPHRDVEHVTAEKSEWNTVAYVCNIYKDYIGCRLVMEDRAAHQEAVESVKSGGR